MAAAAGAVQDEHRVGDAAVLVAARLAERGVVDAQLRQRLARGEAEVGDDVVALERLETRRADCAACTGAGCTGAGCAASAGGARNASNAAPHSQFEVDTLWNMARSPVSLSIEIPAVDAAARAAQQIAGTAPVTETGAGSVFGSSAG